MTCELRSTSFHLENYCFISNQETGNFARHDLKLRPFRHQRGEEDWIPKWVRNKAKPLPSVTIFITTCVPPVDDEASQRVQVAPPKTMCLRSSVNVLLV